MYQALRKPKILRLLKIGKNPNVYKKGNSIKQNGEYMDIAVLFLEFEEVLFIAVVLMIVLMYLFYVKYPYDKNND
jgi:hypothetical protein